MQNNAQQRIGFHYFPDTLHYSEKDIHDWIPRLNALGAHWITLFAPTERAIPEFFIKELLRAKIIPILHFQRSTIDSISIENFALLLDVYATWGVKYVVFFDQPNRRSQWPARGWSQQNLVERFLDLYIPIAKSALEVGMTPVFPPLMPGGDYWDLTFLRFSINSMLRRGLSSILEKMAFGIYAWFNNRPINWGLGGPERWPNSKPYQSQPNTQDHIGFRIFDWYQATITAELGTPLPMILMRVGYYPFLELSQNPLTIDPVKHAENHIAIIQQLGRKDVVGLSSDNNETLDNVQEPQAHERITDYVIASNFWLLSAHKESPAFDQAWYKEGGNNFLIVDVLRQYNQPEEKATHSKRFNSKKAREAGHLIEHYLLLSRYAWGVAQWDLEAIQPYVQRFHPTVGFSVNEARLAKRVTLYGPIEAFSKYSIEKLRKSGCAIDFLQPDGTVLAF